MDVGNTEAFTTETLGLAAQYEVKALTLTILELSSHIRSSRALRGITTQALRVWEEYVKRHGYLEPERARQLV